MTARPDSRDESGATTEHGSVLVAHDGGPRNGHVAIARVPAGADHLVYDGPRWLAVYRRTCPVHTVTTPQGNAEVWSVWG